MTGERLSARAKRSFRLQAMRAPLLLALFTLACASCAHEDFISVRVAVSWPESEAGWPESSRWISVPRGATVEDATRLLLRWPRGHGAFETRRDFFTKMLLRSTANDPREDQSWAWSVGGVFPQVSAAQWVVKAGDEIRWSWRR